MNRFQQTESRGFMSSEFAHCGKLIQPEPPKSYMKIGDLMIAVNKRFNKLQKWFYKISFGILIEDVNPEK